MTLDVVQNAAISLDGALRNLRRQVSVRLANGEVRTRRDGIPPGPGSEVYLPSKDSKRALYRQGRVVWRDRVDPGDHRATPVVTP